MTRYYFDIRDGDELSEDDEGMEFVDLAAAQQEAISALADMTRDKLRVVGSAEARNLVIEIRDENGIVMYARVRFDAERLQ